MADLVMDMRLALVFDMKGTAERGAEGHLHMSL